MRAELPRALYHSCRWCIRYVGRRLVLFLVHEAYLIVQSGREWPVGVVLDTGIPAFMLRLQFGVVSIFDTESIIYMHPPSFAHGLFLYTGLQI